MADHNHGGSSHNHGSGDAGSLEVKVAGATLAAVLHDVAHADTAEGLIFGSVVTHTTSTLDNATDAEVSVETASVVVHAFVPAPLGATGPGALFSPQNGGLNTAAVEALRADGRSQDVILGWYSFRRATPLRPSMREIAACRALLSSGVVAASNNGAALPGLSGTLLCVLAGKKHSSEIISYDYRFFDVNAEAKSATALSVAIGNLVTSTESEYSDFRPTPGLVPALPAISEHLNKQPPDYVANVVGLYKTMVDNVSSLSATAAETDAEVFGLEEEVAALEAELAARRRLAREQAAAAQAPPSGGFSSLGPPDGPPPSAQRPLYPGAPSGVPSGMPAYPGAPGGPGAATPPTYTPPAPSSAGRIAPVASGPVDYFGSGAAASAAPPSVPPPTYVPPPGDASSSGLPSPSSSAQGGVQTGNLIDF